MPIIKKKTKTASLKININNKRLFWEKPCNKSKLESNFSIMLKCVKIFKLHYYRVKARTNDVDKVLHVSRIWIYY